LTLQPVDLHRLVAEAVEELRLAFPGRHLVHRRKGEGPCRAAPDRLAQLLGNLVGNAFAYGAADAPVTVTSGLEGGFASLAVHNFGAPVPERTRAVLFEPMVRGADVGSDVRSVGLGLFIVKAIADAHRGSVSVESTAEQGTVFRLLFPRT
jgi:sigma-B regulation protein RsbU (phosphoserine phosphatase)